MTRRQREASSDAAAAQAHPEVTCTVLSSARSSGVNCYSVPPNSGFSAIPCPSFNIARFFFCCVFLRTVFFFCFPSLAGFLVVSIFFLFVSLYVSKILQCRERYALVPIEPVPLID